MLTRREGEVLLAARDEFRSRESARRAFGVQRGSSPEDVARAERRFCDASLKNWRDNQGRRMAGNVDGNPAMPDGGKGGGDGQPGLPDGSEDLAASLGDARNAADRLVEAHNGIEIAAAKLKAST